MIRIILLLSALGAVAIGMACGSSPANNSNVYLVNANSVNVANNANVPAVIDNPVNVNVNASEVNSPVASSTTAPVNTTVSKGTTPTPGIPSAANANKTIKPGVTPTPGIPDRETLRRQMQGLDTTNINAAPGGDIQMRPMKRGNGVPNRSAANHP